MCRFHNFRAFLRLLLTVVAAATLPLIWLISAKFEFSLTNHMFAALPTVPWLGWWGPKLQSPCSLPSGNPGPNRPPQLGQQTSALCSPGPASLTSFLRQSGREHLQLSLWAGLSPLHFLSWMLPSWSLLQLSLELCLATTVSKFGTFCWELGKDGLSVAL